MCVRRRNFAVVDQILGLGHGRRALAGGRAGERRRLGPGLRPRSEFGRGSFAPFPASSEIQRPRWESSPASAKRRSGNRYQRVLSITKMVYHAGQNIRGAKSCIRHSLCLRVMGQSVVMPWTFSKEGGRTRGGKTVCGKRGRDGCGIISLFHISRSEEFLKQIRATPREKMKNREVLKPWEAHVNCLEMRKQDFEGLVGDDQPTKRMDSGSRKRN